MSIQDPFEKPAVAIEQFLGLSIAKELSGQNVLFRDVNTGQFAFSADKWTYFRENYEELKAAGAF